MPKMKTHTGAKKRYKVTGTGKILEVPAGGFIKVGVAKNGTGPQYAFAVAVKVRASRVA